jgi:hypothetical protein
MLAAVDQLAKGATAVMHEVALLRSEVSSLRKANEALSKRWRAKRTRVQLGGLLTTQDAMDLLGQKAVGREGVQETQADGSGAGGGLRGFGAAVCAVSLAIMPAPARRLQKHLIQLLLM